MVYKNTFVVDLSHMQSIKQLRDGPLSVGCMSCLYICLGDKFEIFEMTSRLWVVHALLVEEEQLK